MLPRSLWRAGAPSDLLQQQKTTLPAPAANKGNLQLQLTRADVMMWKIYSTCTFHSSVQTEPHFSDVAYGMSPGHPHQVAQKYHSVTVISDIIVFAIIIVAKLLFI